MLPLHTHRMLDVHVCLTRVTPGETQCWGTGRHKNCGGAGDGGDPAQTSYYTDTDGGGGYYYY